MNSEYKYEVRGYLSQKYASPEGGCELQIGCDTLKEATSKARFCITQQNAMQSESSVMLGYSQVINRLTGEIVKDFINIGICQNCSQSIHDCKCPKSL